MIVLSDFLSSNSIEESVIQRKFGGKFDIFLTDRRDRKPASLPLSGDRVRGIDEPCFVRVLLDPWLPGDGSRETTQLNTLDQIYLDWIMLLMLKLRQTRSVPRVLLTV